MNDWAQCVHVAFISQWQTCNVPSPDACCYKAAQTLESVRPGSEGRHCRLLPGWACRNFSSLSLHLLIWKMEMLAPPPWRGYERIYNNAWWIPGSRVWHMAGRQWQLPLLFLWKETKQKWWQIMEMGFWFESKEHSPESVSYWREKGKKVNIQ